VVAQEGPASSFRPIKLAPEHNMSRTPNDDRSDSMNPNNDAYDDAQDNRSNQLNPNNERYQGDESDDE
jgi:hypothetical protein